MIPGPTVARVRIRVVAELFMLPNGSPRGRYVKPREQRRNNNEAEGATTLAIQGNDARGAGPRGKCRLFSLLVSLRAASGASPSGYHLEAGVGLAHPLPALTEGRGQRIDALTAAALTQARARTNAACDGRHTSLLFHSAEAADAQGVRPIRNMMTRRDPRPRPAQSLPRRSRPTGGEAPRAR